MSINTFQLPVRRRRSLSREAKRKRASHDEDGDEDDVEEPQHEKAQAPSGRSITSLTANQAEQYRVAGLNPSEIVPPSPFPHSPTVLPPPIRGTRSHRAHDDERVRLGQRHSLRQQHMANLTAIMHRCLLDSDFERAGKAWSLLLRSEPPLDIRQADRWGIGAELLMRSSKSKASDASRHDSHAVQRDNGLTGEGETPGFADEMVAFQDAGLAAARQYYERLIVQFPNLAAGSKQPLPRASTFYPPLFSVWLFQISMARDRALRQVERRAGARYFEGGQALGLDERRAMLEDVHRSELREARLIDARLEGLRRAPPYDRDEHLRELHEMVSLWVSDLDVEVEQHEDDSPPSSRLRSSDHVEDGSPQRANEDL